MGANRVLSCHDKYLAEEGQDDGTPTVVKMIIFLYNKRYINGSMKVGKFVVLCTAYFQTNKTA